MNGLHDEFNYDSSHDSYDNYNCSRFSRFKKPLLIFLAALTLFFGVLPKQRKNNVEAAAAAGTVTTFGTLAAVNPAIIPAAIIGVTAVIGLGLVVENWDYIIEIGEQVQANLIKKGIDLVINQYTIEINEDLKQAIAEVSQEIPEYLIVEEVIQDAYVNDEIVYNLPFTSFDGDKMWDGYDYSDYYYYTQTLLPEVIFNTPFYVYDSYDDYLQFHDSELPFIVGPLQILVETSPTVIDMDYFDFESPANVKVCMGQFIDYGEYGYHYEYEMEAMLTSFDSDQGKIFFNDEGLMTGYLINFAIDTFSDFDRPPYSLVQAIEVRPVEYFYSDLPSVTVNQVSIPTLKGKFVNVLDEGILTANGSIAIPQSIPEARDRVDENLKDYSGPITYNPDASLAGATAASLPSITLTGDDVIPGNPDIPGDDSGSNDIGIIEAIKGIPEAIWGFFNWLYDLLMQILNAILALPSTIANAASDIKASIQNLPSAIASATSAALSWIASLPDSIVNGIDKVRTAIQSGVSSLTGTLTNVWDSIKAGTVSITDSISAGFTWALDSIKALFVPADFEGFNPEIEELKELFFAKFDFIKEPVEAIKQSFTSPKSLYDLKVTFLEQDFYPFSSVFKPAVDYVKPFFNAVVIFLTILNVYRRFSVKEVLS